MLKISLGRHDAPILNDRFAVGSHAVLPRFDDDEDDDRHLDIDEEAPHHHQGYDNSFGMDKMDTFESGGGAADTGVFKYPHLQLRNVSYDVKTSRNGWERVLEGINIEVKGGEIVAIMATNRKCQH